MGEIVQELETKLRTFRIHRMMAEQSNSRLDVDRVNGEIEHTEWLLAQAETSFPVGDELDEIREIERRTELDEAIRETGL